MVTKKKTTKTAKKASPKKAAPGSFRSCLVTGGAGMVGREIARQLVAQGKRVRVFDLEPFEHAGVESVTGDIRDRAALLAACRGMEVVIHAAAAVWNPAYTPAFYQQVNVDGTANVIDACRALGIGRLVHTSTMDVVHDGARPILDGDESLPYPARVPADHYCRTKIEGERMVLAANGPELLTCALRPAGVYGPRDRYHVANLLRAAKKGIPARLGNGAARFSHVYSENVAHAHVLAAHALVPGSPVAGNAYFITDHHPATNLFEFMEPIFTGLGLKMPKRTIPYPLVYVLALINEKVNPRSNFNRFAVCQICVDHTFVHRKAEADFGYRPIVSLEESIRRTVEWFRENPGFYD